MRKLSQKNDICKKFWYCSQNSGKNLEKFDFKEGSVIISAFFDKNNQEYLKIKNNKKNRDLG